jgi:hypothetical protein
VQEPELFESSMIINEANGSMIVNEQDNSMVEVEVKEKPVNFLNRYILEMKSSENEVEVQREYMRKKVQDYDAACLREL